MKSARSCVPPLVLQPLVENAVHHGVAHLLEGGEVNVTARQRQSFLEIVVENPCDPDRPPSRSTGMGLANVRSRIETLCGNRASVDVDARETSFRVSILLPVDPVEVDRSAAVSDVRQAKVTCNINCKAFQGELPCVH